jgi:hypothetical protein
MIRSYCHVRRRARFEEVKSVNQQRHCWESKEAAAVSRDGCASGLALIDTTKLGKHLLSQPLLP